MPTSTYNPSQTKAKAHPNPRFRPVSSNQVAAQVPEPRVVEYGYTCQDGVWYRVFKAETAEGIAQQNMRVTDRGYTCQNGVWYKCIGLEKQPV